MVLEETGQALFKTKFIVVRLAQSGQRHQCPLYFKLCVCVCVLECSACRGQMRAVLLGAGDTRGCEPFNMSSRNQIQVLL